MQSKKIPRFHFIFFRMLSYSFVLIEKNRIISTVKSTKLSSPPPKKEKSCNSLFRKYRIDIKGALILLHKKSGVYTEASLARNELFERKRDRGKERVTGREGEQEREISFDLIRDGGVENGRRGRGEQREEKKESRMIRGRVTRVCHGNMAWSPSAEILN